MAKIYVKEGTEEVLKKIREPIPLIRNVGEVWNVAQLQRFWPASTAGLCPVALDTIMRILFTVIHGFSERKTYSGYFRTHNKSTNPPEDLHFTEKLGVQYAWTSDGANVKDNWSRANEVNSINNAEHALVTPSPLKKSRFSRERLFSILFVSWNSRVFQFV